MSKNEITGILGGEDKNILSTGNSEIDKKIADGLLGSLTLIEGENDTGKSVLAQQIIWGAMKQGLNVDIFSTEMTTKSFLSQMESMSLDVSDYFAWGYVRLFPIHAADLSWSEEQMEGSSTMSSTTSGKAGQKSTSSTPHHVHEILFAGRHPHLPHQLQNPGR